MDEGFFVVVFFSSSFDEWREGWWDGPLARLGRGRCIRVALGPLAGGMVDFYDVDDNDLDTGDSSRE